MQKDICLRLKYQVIPEIKNEIALRCARYPELVSTSYFLGNSFASLGLN